VRQEERDRMKAEGAEEGNSLSRRVSRLGKGRAADDSGRVLGLEGAVDNGEVSVVMRGTDVL
jgi:hypothetical protein